MAIVHHPESGISFCDVHYQVADTAEECAQCAIGTPRPTAWIDYHAIERWQQRISPAAKSEVITALQRIVTKSWADFRTAATTSTATTRLLSWSGGPRATPW
jgi:hypothetical protein